MSSEYSVQYTGVEGNEWFDYHGAVFDSYDDAVAFVVSLRKDKCSWANESRFRIREFDVYDEGSFESGDLRVERVNIFYYYIAERKNFEVNL